MNSQLFRGLAAALAVAALGAGAAACGSTGSTGSTGKSGASGASQASSAPGSSSSPTSSMPGNTSASGTTTGASGSSTGGQAGASEAVGRCHTGDLAIGFRPGIGPDMHGNQTTAALWLKNTSGHTCTLDGFPGVDIINKSDPNNPWSLRRAGATPTKVTLRPGAQTGFVITLLPADGSYSQSERVVPETVLVTPPGETQHFTLKWPYGGAIVNQSMATRPGTYVGPING